MPEAIRENIHVPFEPSDIPGLVSYWDFSSPGTSFTADLGEPYTLISRTGQFDLVKDPDGPQGGTGIRIDEGQWLEIPRSECPRLDIHGMNGHLSVIAWIRRDRTKVPQCEFIAGQWNETNKGRQYGLFINISVWGLPDRICGHLSNTGGPSPGYRYCTDGAMGATEIEYGQWSVIAMSYDGQAGYAWLNGSLDVRPELNPYPLAGGLHDGGQSGSDFTVGAVDRGGEIGNFFCGDMAGLAVYDRALTPSEMFALARI